MPWSWISVPEKVVAADLGHWKHASSINALPVRRSRSPSSTADHHDPSSRDHGRIRSPAAEIEPGIILPRGDHLETVAKHGQDRIIPYGASKDDNLEIGRQGRFGRRLFTATLIDQIEECRIFVFEATMAVDRAEAREWLRHRRGDRQARLACVLDGFDSAVPIFEAMVSPAIEKILEQAYADPESVLADGLQVSIEQRFSL